MTDLAAKIAALKAKKAAELAALKSNEPENKNETSISSVPMLAVDSTNLVTSDTSVSVQEGVVSEVTGGVATIGTVSTSVISTPVPTPIAGAGTARTTDINTLDFLSKVQDLEQAIVDKHPKMPVLLALIHKQIAADPELVTTLSEEEIGVIVNGLKQQTKTELVGTILKQPKAREKKTVLSADMF